MREVAQMGMTAIGAEDEPASRPWYQQGKGTPVERPRQVLLGFVTRCRQRPDPVRNLVPGHSRDFRAPGAGQEHEPHNPGIWRCGGLCGRPEGSYFIVGQDTLASPLLGTGSGHPADDGRTIIVRPAGVPVHDLANRRQHTIGHDQSAAVRYVVQYPNDIGPLDLLNRLVAQLRIDVPFQRPFSGYPGSQIGAVPAEVLLADSPGG